MITLILAYINSKFDTGYELLFLGTILIDYILVMSIYKLLSGD